MGIFSKVRSSTTTSSSLSAVGAPTTSNRLLTKTFIPNSLQIRNSSSSYDEDDDTNNNNNINKSSMILSKKQESKTNNTIPKKKTKMVWRPLQDDDVVVVNVSNKNTYIPPPPFNHQHQHHHHHQQPSMEDPFTSLAIATTSTSTTTTKPFQSQNNITGSLSTSITNGVTTTTSVVNTKTIANKRFHRLDSTEEEEDNTTASSSSISPSSGYVKQNYKSNKDVTVHKSSITTTTDMKKKNKNNIVLVASSSSLAKQNRHNSSSSKMKMGVSSSSPLLLSSNTKSTSSIASSTTVSDHQKNYTHSTNKVKNSKSISYDKKYYPPPDMMKMTNSNTKSNNNRTKTTTMNTFTTHCVNTNDGFDIRSESTGSENALYQKQHSYNEDGSISTDVYAQQSNVQPLSHNDNYSEVDDTDSHYPIVTSNSSNSFQQIIFDDAFQKVTATTVTKSDTGGSNITYSDLVKAATKLTKVLSPEPIPIAGIGTKKASVVSLLSSGTTTSNIVSDSASSNNNMFSDSSVVPTSLPTRQMKSTNKSMQIKINTTASKGRNGKLSTKRQDQYPSQSQQRDTSNDSVDGMSYTSNQSSCKSRSDYQAAIRAKIRSPILKMNNVARTGTATNNGIIRGSSGPATTISTPISTANATFSNSVISSGNTEASLDRFVLSNTKKKHHGTFSNNDPFMIASDFNVTKFPPPATTSNDVLNHNDNILIDDDPFQIGIDVVNSGGSHDSAWDVAVNPFPYLGSSDSNNSCTTSVSQNSHNQKSQLSNRDINHRYFDEVGKAKSMDDALIESIRNHASNSRGHDFHNRQQQRDPSPHQVRISHSDSALEYRPYDSYHTYNNEQDQNIGHDGYYNSGSNMQQQMKKRNTSTKGVPANAIIGSMLFRQTQTCEEYCSDSGLSKSKKVDHREKRSNERTCASPKSDNVRFQNTKLKKDDAESSIGNYNVPRNVHADTTAKSDVSSVTEEASTFHTKNLMNHKWNQQALNVLNQYNVQRKKQIASSLLQVRDMNTYTNH